jgi:hypothetical protein
MSDLRLFALGIIAALLPSFISLAVILWRSGIIKRHIGILPQYRADLQLLPRSAQDQSCGESEAAFYCPVTGKAITQATKDNEPLAVWCHHCERSHLFPREQAQETSGNLATMP